jgi:hypothetical protein
VATLTGAKPPLKAPYGMCLRCRNGFSHACYELFNGLQTRKAHAFLHSSFDHLMVKIVIEEIAPTEVNLGVIDELLPISRDVRNLEE